MSNPGTGEALMETSRPRLYNARAMVTVWLYGVLLSVPVALVAIFVTLRHPNIWSILAPIVVLMLTAYFLPFGFGNAFISRLAHQAAAVPANANAFVVQLKLAPPLRKGWASVLDDAEDVGLLEIHADRLTFHGDAVKMMIPKANIEEVHRENIGLRGLYLYGSRVLIFLNNFHGLDAVEFAERGSLTIPQSRRLSTSMFEQIRKLAPASGSDR